MGDQHQRGGRNQRDFLNELRRHADLQGIHVGEALGCREARPSVDHDGAEAQLLGHHGERHRHVARPHDQHDGGRREDLREGAHVLQQEGAGLAGRDGRPGLGREPLVEEGVAQRALAAARVQQEHLRPVVRRIEPGQDRGAPAPLGMGAGLLVERERRVVGPAEAQGLQEHLDGATAGEPDLPCLLVAQVQLQQPRRVRAQHVRRLLDDLRVHAAADGHRAEHAAALAHQHLGAFLPGRRAARVDERRDRDLGLALLEPVQIVEELVGHDVTSGSDARRDPAGSPGCAPPRSDRPAAGPPPFRGSAARRTGCPATDSARSGDPPCA